MTENDTMKKALAETLTACAACFRVLARHRLAEEAAIEMDKAGVTENFGVRSEKALELSMPIDPKVWQP